jgi:hypothetical protein
VNNTPEAVLLHFSLCAFIAEAGVRLALLRVQASALESRPSGNRAAMALNVFEVSQFVQATSPDQLVMLTIIFTDCTFADRTGHLRRVAQISSTNRKLIDYCPIFRNSCSSSQYLNALRPSMKTTGTSSGQLHR